MTDAGPITGEHTPPVVCVKTGNGVTWKWLVGALLVTGAAGASAYASMRVNHAVLDEKVAGLSSVDARHDTAIAKLFQAMHRIEIRQVEMASPRVRGRSAFPPVPPAPKPEEIDP